jgi:Fe-S cluster assembly ATPase SufC
MLGVDPAAPPLFEIDDLRVAPVEPSAGRETGDILHGVSLTVRAGEVHALMGPNGSGKSTLASTLMGSPEYQVTGGEIRFHGDDISTWGPDDRGRAGIFLAFQYPQEVAGVPVRSFLRQAMGARKGIDDMSVLEVRAARPEMGTLVITHYQRLLTHLRPDVVHILVDGRIVESGGPEIAERLEHEGFAAWQPEAAAIGAAP